MKNWTGRLLWGEAGEGATKSHPKAICRSRRAPSDEEAFLEDEARAGGFCAKYRDPCPSSSSWAGAVLPWWWLVAEVVVAILTRRDAL